MNDHKLRIGITFIWSDTIKHLWSNGLGQNLYFLYQILMAQPNVEDVFFVYWNNDINNLSKDMGLDDMGVKLCDMGDVIDSMDILIEGSCRIDPPQAEMCRQRGIKTIIYRMGDSMIADSEKFVNKEEHGTGFIGLQYDGAWLIPQFMETNHDYLQIMTKTRVREVPHLWSPFFFDLMAERQGCKDTVKYKSPENHKYRIATFEPNISMVKTSMLSTVICEQAYRWEPEVIEHAFILNTFEHKDVPAYVNVTGRMDIVKMGRLSTETRFIAPGFMSAYTDLILSHQWGSTLNYAFYEALYAEYPFVHNTPLLHRADVGYYYPDFDAYEGARQVLYAIHHYDEEREDMVKKNKKFLETLDPLNPYNIKMYGDLLQDVLDGKNRL